MPKKTWNIMVDGRNFEVQADISGRQRIWVNGEMLLNQYQLPLTAQDYAFTIRRYPAYVRMTQGFIETSLDLIVDGISVETGKPIKAMEPMPAWGWVFVAACLAMIVVGAGSTVPVAFAFGSATGVYSIMNNPTYDHPKRIALSSMLTLGAWVLMLMVGMAVFSTV